MSNTLNGSKNKMKSKEKNTFLKTNYKLKLYHNQIDIY